MGKPQNKVKIQWSPNFAYAIGLLTTDGSLSKDGRHLNFTSKDLEQIKNFMNALGIDIKIGFKSSGHTDKKFAYVQFGDVNFYRFLLGIGLMPNKTKKLAELDIPDKYFFDFLRGHLDGDGTFFSFWDPKWKSSFMFYTVFLSASKKHLIWIKDNVDRLVKIKGNLDSKPNRSTYQLRYAKTGSLKLLRELYTNKKEIYLSRKYLKIKKCLGIIGQSDLI